MCAALIVHTDSRHLEALVTALRKAGVDAHGVAEFEEAREQLRQRPWDVLVSTVQLGAYNGLQLVHRARAMYPQMTLVLTGRGPDPAVEREASTVGASYLSDDHPERQARFVTEQCRVLLAPESLSEVPSKTEV
jgi:DNA-binding response OmpR family regulator